MQITDSARRHGIADEDALHALRLATRRVIMDEAFTLYIGPARNGALLEIGVVADGTEDMRLIHAMVLRKAFYRYL